MLAQGGGVFGWVVADFLTSAITPVGATIVMSALALLSVFIITRTPPNRVGRASRGALHLPLRRRGARARAGATGPRGPQQRLGGDYHRHPRLRDRFGARSADNLPWWRRGKKREVEPAYDTPIVSTSATDVFSPLSAPHTGSGQSRAPSREASRVAGLGRRPERQRRLRDRAVRGHAQGRARRGPRDG